MTYPHFRQDKISTLLNQHNIEETSIEKLSILSQTIDKTLAFNNSLTWDKSLENISLANTAKDLIEIYMLRSQIYKDMGYDKEFPDTIKGLNFDSYDVNSAIIFTRSEGKITGTCRIIFDSEQKLPMDKNFSLNYLRDKNKKLGELSRLIIEPKTKGLGQEPKLLTRGAYLLMKSNQMTTLMSVMIKKHYIKLYKNFGGFKIEDELESYGDLLIPFAITSWEIEDISKYFKRMFLSF